MKLERLITDKYYKTIIVEDLILKENYKNLMQIPEIAKISLNSSSKQFVNDKKNFIPALLSLELISGQRVSLTRIKKSIATFKVRKKQIIGGKVTLRKKRMISFLEKWLKIELPRLQENIGRAPQNTDGTTVISFDKKGNLNMGIENTLLFPELENYFQFFENSRGLTVSVRTSTKSTKKEKSILFLSAFKLPYFY